MGCDDLLSILGKSVKESRENIQHRENGDYRGKWKKKVQEIKGKIGYNWELSCPV